MTRTHVAIVAALSVAGCAYQVQPTQVAALNIYSVHDSKIPGRYFLTLDPSLYRVDREIRASSHSCSAHTYPIVVGNSLALSTRRTIESVFESVEDQRSSSTMDKSVRGSIFVRLDGFNATLRCQPGFWSGYCTATTEISLGAMVMGQSGTLFSNAVYGNKTVDADAGNTCDGAANVLSQSITAAMRDALERLGERLTNSDRIRNAR